MKTTLYKISNWLIAFSASAFLLLYFILSFNDRFSANEDIGFITLTKGRGFVEVISWIYQTWSGRWSSAIYLYGLMSSSISFQNIHYLLFAYHLLTILILLYSVYSLVRIGTLKLFNIALNKKTGLVISILFISGFYFSTFQIIEVWWWTTASVDHLQGIVFLLFGTSLLFKENKKLIHYILLSVSFLYIGGSYEIYSLIILTLFLSFFIYTLFFKKGSLKQFYFFKEAIVAFISLAIAASICFSASGNFKRKNFYATSQSDPTMVSAGCSVTPEVFMQKQYLLALGISALCLIAGTRLKNKNEMISIGIKFLMRISLLLLITSIVVTYLFQLIFLPDFLIPLRGWTLTSFSLFTFCCCSFLYIGYYIDFSKLFENSFASALPILIFGMLSAYVYSQYHYTNSYSKKYDELIHRIVETRENKSLTTLEVDPLPNSGMLLQLEIIRDHNEDPLREILDYSYEIKVKR